MHNNRVRKKIFYQIPVLLLILAISVPMVTAPISSNILFSSSSIQVDQFVYAQEDGDGGDSDSSGDGGDSDSRGQTTSSTTTTSPGNAADGGS